MDRKQAFSRIPWIVSVTLVFMNACSGSPVAAPFEIDRQASLALVNGTLIDGTGAAPIPDAVVLVAGDRILAAGSGETVNVPGSALVIDLEGATILPAFINAHVHFAFNKDNLQAWAFGGVTTVRDEGIIGGSGYSSALAQPLSNRMAFRTDVNKDPKYARLISNGYMITVSGGYGEMFIMDPSDARQAVSDELSAGVDGIKVSLEDGYAGVHGLPKLSPMELAAIVDAAHARGMPVSGHITQGAYLQPMLEAGVDDIAHLPYDFISPEALKRMVDQNVALVPTFTVFRNYGAPTGTMQDNLRQFVNLGGRVALGNDYGGGPGSFELGIPMYEIQMMSQSGMSPMQIILSSTFHAACVLHINGETGTLEAGKLADILVVDGNPLQDLEALTAIRLVVHNGVVIRDENKR